LSLQELQEQRYDEAVDYRIGSPHLAHWWLYDRLVKLVRDELALLQQDGRTVRVLELGAGHGGYTEPVLAAGCEVTALEMSRPSLGVLQAKYGHNDRFRGIFDPDGDLTGVTGEHDLVLAVSVLHHVVDYRRFVAQAADTLAPGGTLLTLQDPLWYPRMPAAAHRLDRAAFLAWRLGQGNLRRGLATTARRLRGVYEEDRPEDMVEYHVVRQGVDEEAVVAELRDRFEAVSLTRYWSNQSAAAQRVGDALGQVNTFGVIARGRR
jgi:SAM-dependent methyltransferase